jgi:hypothetical protein
MSGGKKGNRSANDRFDPEAMTHALKPLAILKKPPCDFEFEEYGKTRRTQGPDRDGLEFYEPVLSKMLKFAARSSPKKALIKIVWLQLEEDHKIKSKRYECKTIDEWADMCVDRVSTATYHLRNLALSRTIYVTAKLKSLMAMVDIGDDRSTSPAARTTSTSTLQAPTPPRTRLRRSLQTQLSDASSCAICSIDCKCEDCHKPTFISLVSPNPSPAKSETSNAAEENDAFVPAARGGQKKAATAAKDAKDAAQDGEPVAKKPKVMKKPSGAEASSKNTGAS